VLQRDVHQSRIQKRRHRSAEYTGDATASQPTPEALHCGDKSAMPDSLMDVTDFFVPVPPQHRARAKDPSDQAELCALLSLSVVLYFSCATSGTLALRVVDAFVHEGRSRRGLRRTIRRSFHGCANKDNQCLCSAERTDRQLPVSDAQSTGGHHLVVSVSKWGYCSPSNAKTGFLTGSTYDQTERLEATPVWKRLNAALDAQPSRRGLRRTIRRWLIVPVRMKENPDQKLRL
jgi:hypothetical protein